MKEVKKRLNAKLECPLAGPHTLSHKVSERDICNNFYSTIFLNFFFYSFLELNNCNGYVCAIYNCCFTAYL